MLCHIIRPDSVVMEVEVDPKAVGEDCLSKEELVRGSLRLDLEQEVELCALLAQAEYGDYNQNTAEYFYTRIYSQQPSPATMNSITERHKELRGISQASAEYRALQLVSSLENYGVEWHWAWDTQGHMVTIGVGPEGLFICKEDFMPSERIMYSAIQMATQSRKNVHVTITKESGDALVLIFKFITTGAAVGLLDCAITEIHVFYREVHDRTRRALFSAGPGAAGRGGSGVSPARHAREEEEEDEDESTCKSCSKTHLLHEKLQRLQEALTCALCCEVELNSAFYPCGHAACCYNCAAQLQWCPVCCSGVENVRRIYLPTCASLLGLTEPRGKANTPPGRPRGSQSLAEKSVARMSVASS
ncbi:hypothetical protein P4O66_001403 [Electrophorus voltai]|uniref:RING-type domain-containing protein n=1 Tax=Electrophorus voltai TaxID=2609070 RepID=A0AAD9DVU8_9TELE|nr:hypothetical protein P4O66_001403 [Electrophorus voltai]